MNNPYLPSWRFLYLGVFLIFSGGCTTKKVTDDSREKTALKSSHWNVDSFSKTTPIHIHLFSTEGADIGNSKFKDVTQSMANAAPHLLAADIAQMLRESGFQQVTLDETQGGAIPGTLNLTGRFTALDPGSQNLRLWIGFGAGTSRVCIDGTLTDSNGTVLGTFSHCDGGIGWGGSEPQLKSETHSIGKKVGLFLAGRAE